MKLVVLGAAESGVGAAILAQQKGYEVFVSDRGEIQPRYKSMLEEYGIAWEEGQHTEARIMAADEVIKSPGIPDTVPLIVALHEKQVPVISDIEFAARHTRAKKLCITGSNGKTTTTSLIYYIMERAGLKVGLAGNIGRSFALQVAESAVLGMPDWFVLEISSFQLDTMFNFRANIAVLLNITPDHLDRYEYRMENYVASKMRIAQNQRPTESFIYWADDEHISQKVAQGHFVQKLFPFTDFAADGSTGYGLGTAGDDAYGFAPGGMLRIEHPKGFEMPLSELSLKGRHNLRNCIAAALATLEAGVDPEVVKECLREFTGVEHRLEPVGTFRGVHYINDSKATNVDACFVALKAQTTPVVLIVGGTDKGNDYTTLHELVREKCRAIVYLGADNAPLHEAFDDLAQQHHIAVADTHSMADCVAACAELAQPGDTVLLSPCCASFDLFQNMADRGRQFKALAKALGQ
ncbi:MAG: UDP-N-acetylmuramoyl-L-alanine--D-glutamate ligase [Bacteroidaceae bacterium]|nr:UDP-N-acetylmuramoyl-L-alanine--D-glutamate ligase [Bacteroidaceae bacterium]